MVDPSYTSSIVVTVLSDIVTNRNPVYSSYSWYRVIKTLFCFCLHPKRYRGGIHSARPVGNLNVFFSLCVSFFVSLPIPSLSFPRSHSVATRWCNSLNYDFRNSTPSILKIGLGRTSICVVAGPLDIITFTQASIECSGTIDYRNM